MNCTQKNMKEQGRFFAKRMVFQNVQGNGEQGAEKLPVQPEAKETKSPKELREQFMKSLLEKNPTVKMFNDMNEKAKSLTQENQKLEFPVNGETVTVKLENQKAVWRDGSGIEIKNLAVWLQEKNAGLPAKPNESSDKTQNN